MNDSVLKWILRVLSLFFAASVAFMLIGAALDKNESISTQIAPLLPGIILGSLIAGWLWRRSSSADRVNMAGKKKRDALAQEALTYFNAVNASRAFPSVPTERIINRPDSPVLAACNARLLETGHDQVRQYLGARIKVGGLPIYLGQSAPRSARTVIRQSVDGELAITPDSLLFNGVQRSADIELKKVLGSILLWTELRSRCGGERSHSFFSCQTDCFGEC